MLPRSSLVPRAVLRCGCAVGQSVGRPPAAVAAQRQRRGASTALVAPFARGHRRAPAKAGVRCHSEHHHNSHSHQQPSPHWAAGAAGRLKLSCSAAGTPHPDKVASGARAMLRRRYGHAGEDAYATSRRAIALTDGVSGWRKKGIDSSRFSQLLATSVMEGCTALPAAAPLDVVRQAHHRALASGVEGSCTLVVCSLHEDEGVLRAATLGDSGLMVVRGLGQSPQAPTVQLRSVPNTHSFNYPFQLGHHGHGDRPDDCRLVELGVRPGDVVVVGSDGLFDNVMDCDIVGLLAKHHDGHGLRSRDAAQDLVRLAFDNSHDKHVDTPFSLEYVRANNMVHRGGKRDDITVVVAEVRPAW